MQVDRIETNWYTVWPVDPDMTASLSADPIHSGICSDPVPLRRERKPISTILCYVSYIKNPKQWKK
jgi:hypothetical protein